MRTAPEHNPERYREFTRYVHGIAQRLLDRGVHRVAGAVQATTAILEGDPGEELAAQSRREGVALIVCGSRGYGPVRSVLLGSTTRSLLDYCTCPVALIPRPLDADHQYASGDESAKDQSGR